jgi:hypothetical protein
VLGNLLSLFLGYAVAGDLQHRREGDDFLNGLERGGLLRQTQALEFTAIEVYAQYPYWPASSRNTKAFRRMVFNLLAHAQVQGLLHALPFYTTE